jgi:hypothetical protein
MNPRIHLAWRRLLRRVGTQGIAGLALLPAIVAIAWWVPQLNHDTDDLRARIAANAVAGPARLVPKPVSDSERVQQFVSRFPPLGRSATDMSRVFALAQARKINLSKGEYQLTSEPNMALVSYAVTFPVRNEYGALKAFAADVLEALPHVSMDELRMSRTDATTGALDSTVRFTFVYRSP